MLQMLQRADIRKQVPQTALAQQVDIQLKRRTEPRDSNDLAAGPYGIHRLKHALYASHPLRRAAPGALKYDVRAVAIGQSPDRFNWILLGRYEGGHLTEGVAVAPDGTVFFSDITFTTETGMQAGHILRYDPKSDKTVVYRSPSGMSNGLKFDAQGRMVAAEGADHGGRRITRTDLVTGKSVILAGLFEGKPFNSPNDIAIDV